jgi:uncharacterized protein (TIGR03790 family)
MLKILFHLAIFFGVFVPVWLRADGSEVVVIYNSRMPESKSVAEYYAAARHIPEKQIFSFALTTNEIISRADFRDILQKPLAEKLEAAKLWKFGEKKITDKNGVEHTGKGVVQSKIRYAVLCYGVPLKIAPDSQIVEIVDKMLGEALRRNDASVDSELAWLPLLKMNVPLTGPLPNAFYMATNRISFNPTNGILMVTRLDGPTPEIARGIVDKTMAAESNGFWGRAYFDARGLKRGDSYFLGDFWILGAAELSRRLGFDVEIDTNSETLPASFPMSHIAIYAGWYAENANGPFLQPKMEFMPGAFAYHLHSYSAATLRSTTLNWCGPLLAKGATCTMGCVNEPYLQFTPNIAFFIQALGNQFNFGEAAWAAQPALSWQTTVIGDPLYEPFKNVPAQLHLKLTAEKSPLLEWSFERLINLDLLRGTRELQLVQFLEALPETAQSAVLSERLAEFYSSLGKPGSAIDAWQRALTLNPSPQQKIRLHRVLAEKLLAENRSADAAENLREFISDSPDYSDLSTIREQLKQLEEKIAAQTNAPAK